MNYLGQYDQEKYIFEDVANTFLEKGYLSAYDFFCIVIWKANRAKSKIANKLLRISGKDSLEDAVYLLTNGIYKEENPKGKLRYLIKDWEFHLPMASAILTVLYPDTFTVYDIRVCDELNDFHKLNKKVNFDSIWDGYQSYINRVIEETPSNLSLRDKDRYLWAKSFSDQLCNDIQTNFNSLINK
jgi:hypothetical protein